MIYVQIYLIWFHHVTSNFLFGISLPYTRGFSLARKSFWAEFAPTQEIPDVFWNGNRSKEETLWRLPKAFLSCQQYIQLKAFPNYRPEAKPETIIFFWNLLAFWFSSPLPMTIVITRSTHPQYRLIWRNIVLAATPSENRTLSAEHSSLHSLVLSNLYSKK